NVRLVARQQIEDGGRRRLGRFQHQIVAVNMEFDTGGASRFQGLDRAHRRALQLFAPDSLGADWGGRFASASSAAVPGLDFNGLAQAVGTDPPLRSTASPPRSSA